MLFLALHVALGVVALMVARAVACLVAELVTEQGCWLNTDDVKFYTRNICVDESAV